jgi:hypothetical protein
MERAATVRAPNLSYNQLFLYTCQIAIMATQSTQWWERHSGLNQGTQWDT